MSQLKNFTSDTLRIPVPLRRSDPWLVFVFFIVSMMLVGTGPFLYDAYNYFHAAESVVIGFNNLESYLSFRGMTTAFAYVPAVMLAEVFDARYASHAVLFQNSVVFAWVAAFLFPRLVAIWKPVTARMRLVGAVLVWLVLVGFAPYPLVDVYPAVAVISAVVLLHAKGYIPVAAAGLLAGLAVNARPAYLVCLVGLLIVALVWRRMAGIFFALGILLGLLPQLIVNLTYFRFWALWPIDSASLIELQSGYASYVVRYDTLLGQAQPRQFYCSPDMATSIGSTLPATTGDLARTFLSELPTSAFFSLEKLGASLHWFLDIPYGRYSGGWDFLFALMITSITVAGIAALAYRATLRVGNETRIPSGVIAGLGVVALSTMITIVGSASESRFALPLVLLGVAGCMTINIKSPTIMTTKNWWWVAGTILVFSCVFLFGISGLQAPAPPGFVSQELCAAL